MTPDGVAAVAAATATGSHQEELDRWRDACGADLVEYEHIEVPDALSPARKAVLAGQARGSVEGKTLAEVEEEREGARRWYRLVSKVVLDDEDQARMEAAVVRLDALDEVPEELRDSGGVSPH